MALFNIVPTPVSQCFQDMISRAVRGIPNVEVGCFDGLLAEYARISGAHTIVKGLRAVTDFEYEFQMALINRKLNPEIDTVFLTSSSQHMYLSSSVVKQVCDLGVGIDMTRFVPVEIADEIVRRIKGDVENGKG